MHARFQVHIRHDGKQYMASVPELEGCYGVGDSYAQALAAVEQAMASWVFEAINAGRTVPVPTQDFVWRPSGRKLVHGRATNVMQRIRSKYGNLCNRELASKLGLPSEIEPSGVSAAAAGQGARAVRVALALAVGDRPSRLWPSRSITINQRDDAAFYAACNAEKQP